MKKEVYESPPVGNQIVALMSEIDNNTIRNNSKLKKTLLKILREEKFDVIKTIEHAFNPQGYTLTFLLGESHACLHTYPEKNLLYFDMYSCRGPSDAKPTYEKLRQEINPSKTDVLDIKVDIETGEMKIKK